MAEPFNDAALTIIRANLITNYYGQLTRTVRGLVATIDRDRERVAELEQRLVWRDMLPEAIDAQIKLRNKYMSERDDARRQLEEAQAEAAVMRAALDAYDTWQQHRGACRVIDPAHDCCVDGALLSRAASRAMVRVYRSDAGRKHLERDRQMEAVLRHVREWVLQQTRLAEQDKDSHRVAALAHLRQIDDALAKVEE